MASIDLNADLGETVGGVPTADDEAMFAVISSASIACGGHAGDTVSITAAVERAGRFGVAIGAHPSYDDAANFGRRALNPDPADLRDLVARQLEAVIAAGAVLRYVKPHGALYHAIRLDRRQADAVTAAVAEMSARIGRALPVLGFGGEIERAATGAGLPFVREAFLDRGYHSDGSLVARAHPAGLLADPDAVAARAVRLAEHGEIETADGSVVEVHAASFCVHGDTPAAVRMAAAVRAALAERGIEVRAPW